MDIKDNVALITGGGSGLGKAVALALRAKGAKVALLDMNEASLEQLMNEPLMKEKDALGIVANVAEKSSIEEAMNKIKSIYGVPRICINCAGIIAAERMVNRGGVVMPLENFKRVIEVNLIGTFNVMSIAASEMLALSEVKEERGVIINTASIAAYEGQIGQAAYSASKGGVASMTLPLARELQPAKIRVMAIAPGLFETPMLEKISEKAKQKLLDSTLFPKRLGQPHEFASLVLQIIENPMLNGTVIRLDGGVRLSP